MGWEGKKHKFVICLVRERECCFVLAHSYTRLNTNPLAERPPISSRLKHVWCPCPRETSPPLLTGHLLQPVSAPPWAPGSGPQHALRLLISQWVLWYHSHPREGRLWNSSTHFSQCYLGFTWRFDLCKNNVLTSEPRGF